MDVDRNALPDDIDALKDALLVERARALEVMASYGSSASVKTV